MPDLRDRPARHGLRIVAAAIAAALVSVALVLPALASSGASWLDHPYVTPRVGTTDTVITFRVTYRSVVAEAPSDVHVTVGAVSVPMTAAGARWSFGVTYTARTRLPTGTFDVLFEAYDSLGNGSRVSGGTVTIGPPADPTPSPAATSTPASPSPGPTLPHGGATGGSTTNSGGGGADGTAGGGAASSPPDSGVGPAPTETVAPGSADGASGPGGPGDATGTGSTGQDAKGGGTAPSVPDLGADPAPVDSVDGAGSSGAGPISAYAGHADLAATRIRSTAAMAAGVASGGGSKSPLASFDQGMAALGLGRPGPLPTVPAVVMSSTAVGAWMGFLIFNRRRRDEEEPEPDESLRARAATGIAFAAGTAPGDVDDPEAHLPRWLRPSLREARRIDPARTPAAVVQPMAFATTGASGGAGTLDRRFVRYAVAALLAEPDELRSDRISEVAAGDEVQVEGRSGAYFDVLCPDGRRGWIHRTALSEVPALVAHPWKDAADPALDGENALAALLAARGLQRTAG